jgi:hypothetical protein
VIERDHRVYDAAETRRFNTEGRTMRKSIPIRQVDSSDPDITPVVFGAWVIIRTHSADQLGGWIDVARVGLSATDLDEIAAAIRWTEAAYNPQTPAALAA